MNGKEKLCIIGTQMVITPPGRSTVINPSVCVSVCLPASIYLNCWTDRHEIFCADLLYVVVAWPPLAALRLAIRYVLPVLWMTPRFAVMGRMALAALQYGGRV